MGETNQENSERSVQHFDHIELRELLPRMERGDGRGCPILAIAFSAKCYVPPTLSIPDEVLRVAALRENVVKGNQGTCHPPWPMTLTPEHHRGHDPCSHLQK